MAEEMAFDDEGPIAKVSLLTGFLGSGKTTLLNALVRRPEMAGAAVLVNELGEIGIDHDLVETLDEQSVMLTSGCLCCEAGDDLVAALQDLAYKRRRGEIAPIGRVLIETTGLADPAPIIHAVMEERVAEHYSLDAVVVTVDAVHGARQLDRHRESVKQAALADRLLLTKCDLATAGEVAALERRLADLNPGATPFQVDHGAVSPAKLFDAGPYDPYSRRVDVQGWLRDEAIRAHAHEHHQEHAHGETAHRHDDGVRSDCRVIDGSLDWAAFVAWAQAMIRRHGGEMLRLKGILNVAGEPEPVVVHGVQRLFHHPVYLPGWPGEDRRSRIVLITQGLSAEVVDARLAELQDAVAKTAS